MRFRNQYKQFVKGSKGIPITIDYRVMYTIGKENAGGLYKGRKGSKCKNWRSQVYV